MTDRAGRRCVVLSLPGSHHNTVQEAPSDGQMHLLGNPLVQRCRGSAGMSLLVSCRKLVSVIVGRRYRPELHYMRGPGPKWLERHGRSSSTTTSMVGPNAARSRSTET